VMVKWGGSAFISRIQALVISNGNPRRIASVLEKPLGHVITVLHVNGNVQMNDPRCIC